jgi:hypothetical protein
VDAGPADQLDQPQQPGMPRILQLAEAGQLAIHGQAVLREGSFAHVDWARHR